MSRRRHPLKTVPTRTENSEVMGKQTDPPASEWSAATTAMLFTCLLLQEGRRPAGPGKSLRVAPTLEFSHTMTADAKAPAVTESVTRGRSGNLLFNCSSIYARTGNEEKVGGREGDAK